jgi:hypothetical protein
MLSSPDYESPANTDVAVSSKLKGPSELNPEIAVLDGAIFSSLLCLSQERASHISPPS